MATLASISVLLGIVPEVVARAPVVTIKARTVIRVDPPSRTGFGAVISGVVEDAASGEPVPKVRLLIKVGDELAAATTGEDGAFRVDLGIPTGRHDLQIDYEGDRSYTPAHYELLDFELDRQLVSLAVSASPLPNTDSAAPDGPPSAYEIVVRAAADNQPVVVVAELSIETGGGAAARLGPLLTDAMGRGTIEVSSRQLGGPGRKRVVATFAGNERQHQSSAEAIIVVSAATVLEVKSASTSIGYDGTFHARGAIADIDGAKLANIPIALVAGDRRLAAALSGDDGEFKLAVDADELRAGRHTLEIVAEPVAEWLLPSRSTPFVVEVGQPKPIPIGYMLAASLFTTFGLLGFFVLRNRPWERLGARRTAEAGSPASTPPQAPSGGLRPRRLSMVATLRPADRHTFSGKVIDATTATALAGSAIARDGHTIATAGQDGEFSVDGLDAGDLQFSIHHSGYVTERVAIVVPHRGEFDDATVALISIRQFVFSQYRTVAQAWLPSPAHWGIWTPRQIFEHVHGRQPTAALATLTLFVEETYFSARVPTDATMVRTLELVAAAAAEARNDAAPSAPDLT